MPITYLSPINQPGYAAGDFLYPQGGTLVTDRTPSTSARVTAWPFATSIPVTVDRIGVFLTTPQAGAACMVGIYGSNKRGRLGELLLDAGELSLASGSNLIAATISFRFVGFIWGVVWMKDVATQATVKGLSAAGANISFPQPGFGSSSGSYSGLSLTSAYPASLPTTAPAVTPAGFSIAADPIVILRAA